MGDKESFKQFCTSKEDSFSLLLQGVRTVSLPLCWIIHLVVELCLKFRCLGSQLG